MKILSIVQQLVVEIGDGSYSYNPQMFCWNYKFVDGKNLSASTCGKAETYVSWDGVHITKAPSKIVVDVILHGCDDFTNPSFKIGC